MHSAIDLSDMRPLFVTVITIVGTILLTFAAAWLRNVMIERQDARHARELSLRRGADPSVRKRSL